MTAAPQVPVQPEPADDEALAAAARDLADELDLAPADAEAPLQLLVTRDGLALRAVRGDATLVAGLPVRANPLSVNIDSPHGRSLRQPLAKAVGLRRRDEGVYVIDATAGLGEDSWLLAALGCRVLAVERHPVVFALLRDGIARAAATHGEIAARIDVTRTDALDALRENTCDVVYLDPMFPPARKTMMRKPMRMLRALVGDDADAAALLRPALACARKRVVVKRPLRAPALGDEPTMSFHGKSLRYDVYVVTARAQ